MSKSKQFTWFTIISSLIVIAAIAVPAYLFYRHWKAGQREDFMWVARGQLELMKGDKSVEFLEVSSISCTDDTLDVIFQSGWPHLNRSFDGFADFVTYLFLCFSSQLGYDMQVSGLGRHTSACHLSSLRYNDRSRGDVSSYIEKSSFG